MTAVAAAAAPHPTIALLQTSSLSSVVQGELERMILSGELRPGDKLTEMALAARLGVSRGPLREAFRMLDEAGLVRTEKNRGVFVRDVPIEEALQIFEVRAAMDLYVGRKLAQSLGTTQVKELRQLVDAMEQAVVELEVEAVVIVLRVVGFDRLLELAGNDKLLATYRKLVNELSLFRRQNLTRESMAVYSREHRQIVKAIAAGDADAAGQAMFQHVMNSRERTLRNHERKLAEAAATMVSASRQPALA